MQQSDATKQWNKNAKVWRERFGANDPNSKYLLNNVILDLVGDVQGAKVLDAGCGEGYMSRKLARLGAKMTGIELSAEMLTFAKADEGVESLGINYYWADIADMPFLHDNSLLNGDIVCHRYQSGWCAHWHVDQRQAKGYRNRLARILHRQQRRTETFFMDWPVYNLRSCKTLSNCLCKICLRIEMQA